MELPVNPEMLTSYIYGPTFGNAETVSFYFSAQCFNTESMQRDFLCQLAGKVFTHKCDTGNLSALIQC